MKKGDVTCPGCAAGYRRIELDSGKGQAGQYKCLVCDRVLEVFDGSREVAYRLTVQPSNLHRTDGIKAASVGGLFHLPSSSFQANSSARLRSSSSKVVVGHIQANGGGVILISP